jgi:hypothetical protein
MHQQVANVDYNIFDVTNHFFHQVLKAVQQSKAHRLRDPVEMTLSWYCESSELLGNLIQLHESGPEVRSSIMKMVDLSWPMSPIHSVYVGVLVQLLDVLNNLVTLALFFFGTQKIGELKRKFDF